MPQATVKFTRQWWVQQAIDDLESEVFIIHAGLGCIHPDTKVRTDSGLARISDIYPGQRVLSWNEKCQKYQLSVSSGGFLKGKDYLYRIVTTQGEFEAAGHHRICTSSGNYLPVSALSVGDYLASSCHNLDLTSLGLGQKSLSEDAQRCFETSANSQWNCAVLDYLYGQRFDEVREIDLDVAPLQGDALRCGHNYGLGESLHLDDLQAQGRGHSRHGQSYALQSKQGYACHGEELVVNEADYTLRQRPERTLQTRQLYRRFLEKYERRHNMELPLLVEGLVDGSSRLSLSKARIIAIERKSFKEEYWDISVPGNNNYFTEDGSLHHNSGKTHGTCDWHLDRSLLNSKCNFSAFVMPIYQKIHDAAIPTFLKIFQSLGYQEGRDYKLLKTPYPKIILPRNDGHEIHFFSATRPDKIVAVEYSHASGSECGDYSADALNLIQTRVRNSDSKALQTAFEGAPQGITAFANLFNNADNNHWTEYEKRAYKHKSEPVKRFRLTTYDNPYVPSSYVERLHRIYKGNAPYINSYIYGLFCPLVEGNAYGNFNLSHQIDDLEPQAYNEIAFCWDFNANPLSWVALQRIQYREFDEYKYRWVAIHESEGNSSQLDDAVIEFYKKFPAHTFAHTKIRIFGDSTGHHSSHKHHDNDYKRIHSYLLELGYKDVDIQALKYNPVETHTVEALNKLFLDDEFYVCKRCTNFIRSLVSTRWKEGTKKLDKPAGEDWTHWSDAVKYFAYVIQQEPTNIKKIYI